MGVWGGGGPFRWKQEQVQTACAQSFEGMVPGSFLELVVHLVCLESSTMETVLTLT